MTIKELNNIFKNFITLHTFSYPKQNPFRNFIKPLIHGNSGAELKYFKKFQMKHKTNIFIVTKIGNNETRVN